MPDRLAGWIALTVVASTLYIPITAQAAPEYEMVFPVAGGVQFSDTFGDPRPGGRTHEGQDLIADKMTPVVAVADGTVGWMHNEQGGNCCAMALEHDDGWASWYIHLNNDTPGTDDGQGWGFAPGIEPGAHVDAGQLIGFVGDSGNAEETISHLHFELHDENGVPINSYNALLAAIHVAPSGPPIPNEGCDFDGDQLFDLAVGSDTGGVAYFGSAFGTPLVISNTSVSAVACGDVDGDFYDDLVIGSSSAGAGAGSITIYLGSSSGFQPEPATIDQATVGVPGASEPGDSMGFALAISDFNGDSYDDVAVGLPGEAFGSRPDVGTILLFWGSATGLSGTNSTGFSQATAGAAGGAEIGDRFGSALAAGDFNDDGKADLAVGIPGEDIGAKVDAGAAHVIYGSASGLSVSDDKVWTQSSAGIKGGAEPDDHFGASLHSMDFDHDGYEELLIGVPGEDVGTEANAGAVHLIRGSASGLTAQEDVMIHQNTSGMAGVAEVGDSFGSALAAADFDRDGWMDVAIGIPGEAIGTHVESGAIQVMYGFIDGPTASRDSVLSQASTGVAGAVEAGDFFGSYLLAADLSGDGYPDIATGTPGEDVSGAVNVGLLTLIGLGPTVSHFSHHSGQAGLGLIAESEYGRVGD